jgi:hypothetical protein
LHDKRVPKEAIEDILFGIEEAKDNTQIEKHIMLDPLKERYDELVRQVQELNMQ